MTTEQKRHIVTAFALERQLEEECLPALESNLRREWRNAHAQELLKLGKFTIADGRGYVETWWDRQSRNWITARCDEKGNQVGDAATTGHRDDAAVAHLWKCYELLNLKELKK